MLFLSFRIDRGNFSAESYFMGLKSHECLIYLRYLFLNTEQNLPRKG